MNYQRPLATFYSYAHKNRRDRRHLEELVTALALARREKVIDEWDDSKLRAGEQWEDALIDRARKSRVFLLILTNRFIASDFCVLTELAIARRLYKERAAVIAPILAEDAEWQIDELKDLQVIMPFGKPVSRSTRAEGWTEVARKVRLAAQDLLDDKYFSNVPAAPPPIPPLIPFTIGRDLEIADIESSLRAAPRHRPFICVLTGRRQGQRELIDHLLLDDGAVRKALKSSAAYARNAVDADVWIRAGERLETALSDFLASHLVSVPLSVDRVGIASAFNAHPGVSIVTCELSASEWRACGTSRLQQYLAYWAGWPDLRPEQGLVVLLSICEDVTNLVIPQGLHVRLGDVSREAIEGWLATPPARERFLVDRVRQHLNEAIGRGERLPMEDFAARVVPVLQRFQS